MSCAHIEIIFCAFCGIDTYRYVRINCLSHYIFMQCVLQSYSFTLSSLYIILRSRSVFWLMTRITAKATITHSCFKCFCCMSCSLPCTIYGQYINDGHVVNLWLHIYTTPAHMIPHMIYYSIPGEHCRAYTSTVLSTTGHFPS